MLPNLPTSLALLLLATAHHADAAPKPTTSFTIDLKRRSVQQRSPEELGDWAKALREKMTTKYGGTLTPSTQLDQRASGQNLLINQNADSSFFGSVAIGTPPVSYDVILDTGSSDLWIADAGCTSNCEGIATFASEDSSSFVNTSNTFQITYGSGQAAGVLGRDVVQMAGFSVENQTFAMCDTISTGLLNAPVSGLMGLAFSSIASSRATPFWESLASSGSWDEPVMAFQLTRFSNATNVQRLEYGGTFTMGATNSSLYTGEIEYQNIPEGQETYWLLEMTELNINGNSVSIGSGQQAYAAIDTGTTLIGGPADAIASIYEQIPNSQAGDGNYNGYYFYPCDTDVSVSVAFGGKTWSISSADFLVQQVSNSLCMGAFFELSTGSSAPSWIVGDTFLKNVYSVFRYDPPSIGFAQLSAESINMNGNDNLELPSATVGSAAATIQATGSNYNPGDGALGMGVSIPLMLIALTSSAFFML